MSGAIRAGAAIHLSGVRKSFSGAQVLRDISLNVAPGEFLTIVGRSGCGKSTLLRLLAGLETAEHGGLYLDGKPLREAGADVRLMFQDARLLPWARVLDNVGIGLTGEWRPRAQMILRDVGLEARAAEWPGVLSGGQKQRVALARALVAKPRLLLMDEPLGALDALTRLSMQALIRRIWQAQGFTAILVTHDVQEAVALGGRVIILEAGRIAEQWHVPLPYPRELGNPELAGIEGAVLKRMLHGTAGDLEAA